MAIMWDAAAVERPFVPNSPSAIAWRLRLAQVLVASGYEPAVVKEALFANEPGTLDPYMEFTQPPTLPDNEAGNLGI